jgi:hypothetical protein
MPGVLLDEVSQVNRLCQRGVGFERLFLPFGRDVAFGWIAII